MLYSCSRMCRSIIFPPFFYFLSWKSRSKWYLFFYWICKRKIPKFIQIFLGRCFYQSYESFKNISLQTENFHKMILISWNEELINHFFLMGIYLLWKRRTFASKAMSILQNWQENRDSFKYAFTLNDGYLSIYLSQLNSFLSQYSTHLTHSNYALIFKIKIGHFKSYQGNSYKADNQ